MVDLTRGNKTFNVPTSVTRDGIAYMGPDVRVTARDSQHAKEVARDAGYTTNIYFGPEEIKSDR